MWSRDRERTRRAVEHELRTWVPRLRAPDWALYEAHLGRRVPSALRDLFADPRMMTDALDIALNDGFCISRLAPLDPAGLRDSAELAPDAFAFALTDTGDAIHLLPGADVADRVYVTDHDGGDRALIAESIDELVAQLRRSAAR
jgi:hypothetical protein